MVDIDAIPNKRRPKRIKLFRQGEVGRLILGALREADGEAVSVAQIVGHILWRLVATGTAPSPQ